MSVATVDRPATNTAEMGVIEAKGITLAIKENFDSLGSMLLQARDRKAYKALGYRSFDSYCKTEFGKSISHAYQLIEDVKVVAELEAEISKQYDEPVTLNFPSSHLRSLKEIPGVGDKLKAIEYAQKLAKAEGKTPTKKHLEIAVFEISGKRSEDFRSAIQSLGFTKGTQVEATKSLKKDRGFVTKVDKKGKIYVELYNGGAVPILCDASDLRILEDLEKPAIPANDETAKKGDKVKIFAKGREGQTGELFIWQMGKHAMVKITGEQVPVNIAYAELELIQEKNLEAITVEIIENTPIQWRENLNWTSGENHYYYFAQENKIYNTSWPNNITITPNIHSKENPIEFMEDWIQRFAGNVAKSLVSDTEILIENQRLREQLAEAESAIEAIVDMAREQMEILPEIEQAEISIPGDTAQENWIDLLKSLKFSQQTKYMGVYVETYRDWDIRFLSHDIAIRVVDIVHAKKGCFSYHLDQVDDNLDNFDEIHAWTNNIINQVEDFHPSHLTPGDTAAHTEFPVEDITSTASPLGAEQITEFPVEDITSTASPLGAEQITEFLVEIEIELFPQEMIDRVELERDKLFHRIENFQASKGKTKREQEQNAEKDLKALRHSLSQLEKFEQLKVGQTVWYKRNPEITGEITGFAFTTGGMPHVFVRWNEEEGKNSVISTEIVGGLLVSPPEL